MTVFTLSLVPALGSESSSLSGCIILQMCKCVCEHISVACFCLQLLATVLSQSVKAKEHLLEQSQSVEQSASKSATSPKSHHF